MAVARALDLLRGVASGTKLVDNFFHLKESSGRYDSRRLMSNASLTSFLVYYFNTVVHMRFSVMQLCH